MLWYCHSNPVCLSSSWALNPWLNRLMFSENNMRSNYPQHSHLLPFPQPSPLCRRHPTVFLILPAQLQLQHHPSAQCTSANVYLDDCQSPNSQFLQDWILTHWSQKATWQDTQLLTNTTHSARNLGFIFDEHLTFSDQISYISKACYYHIRFRQLRCIRPYLDSTIACTIATSLVHSKLDYCNSLYLPTEVSDYPPPTDSELSRPCSC